MGEWDEVSDRELVERLAGQAGGAREEAFNALYLRYHRTVLYSTARLPDLDFERAESITAEAFTTAYKDLTAGRGPREADKLAPWLRGIARNRYHEEQRRRGRTADVPDDFEQDTYETLSRQRLAQVDRMLEIVAASFTPGQQRVFQLSTRRHLRGQALAAELGVSEKEANDRTYENKLRLTEGFGAYVLALQGRTYCAELARILDEAAWDGENFTKVLRARIQRHMQTCKTCGNCAVCRQSKDRLVKPFAPVLLPLVAAEFVHDRVTAEIARLRAASSTTTLRQPPGPRPPNRPTGTSRIRRAARRVTRRQWVTGTAGVAVIAAVALFVLPRLLSGGGGGASLAQARAQLASLAPGMTPVAVTVPGGYEAATYDQHTHIDFWRYTSGTWHREAARTYPPDNGDGTGANEHGVAVTGSLLTGTAHATYIVTGPFTGDGTGSTVVFGKGPAGWGYLAVGNGAPVAFTGKGTTDTTGVYYTAAFTGGRLQTTEDTGVFSDAFSGGFPLVQVWRPTSTGFTLEHDNMFTARSAPPLAAAAAALPSGQPGDGTYGATISEASVSTTGAPGSPPQITLTLTPADVSASCIAANSCTPGQTGSISLTVASTTTIIYPVATSQGTAAYLTGPAWALAGLFQDILNTSGYQYPGPWDTPSTYAQYGAAPWYIPSSLGASSFSVYQNEPVAVTFHNGAVVSVQLL